MHSRIEDETLRLDSAERGIEAAFVGLGPALAVALARRLHRLPRPAPLVRADDPRLRLDARRRRRHRLRHEHRAHQRRHLPARAHAPRAARRCRARASRSSASSAASRRARSAACCRSRSSPSIVALGGLYMGRKSRRRPTPRSSCTAGSKVLKDLHYVARTSRLDDELDLMVEARAGQALTDQDVLDWMLALRAARDAGARELQQSEQPRVVHASVTGGHHDRRRETVLASRRRPAGDRSISEDGRSGAITFALGGDATLADQRKASTSQIIDDAHAAGRASTSRPRVSPSSAPPRSTPSATTAT